MKKFFKKIKQHCRYTVTLWLNYFFNHKLFFRLIGGINKRLKIINSIFLAHLAVESDGLAYMPKILFKQYLWKPFFCNIILQNGKIILMFVISAGNAHFTPKHLAEMRALAEEIEEIRRLVGAERKTFAGILPMKMFSRKILSSVPELETAALAIAKAATKFKNLPVVLLSGTGFFSQLLAEKLKKTLVDIQSVSKEWPQHLSGATLVINASINSGIEKLAEFMPRGSIVLNEVYGGICAETLRILKKRNCRLYNIVGIKACALLPMHGQYQGATPTCASWPAPKAKVVLK